MIKTIYQLAVEFEKGFKKSAQQYPTEKLILQIIKSLLKKLTPDNLLYFDTIKGVSDTIRMDIDIENKVYLYFMFDIDKNNYAEKDTFKKQREEKFVPSLTEMLKRYYPAYDFRVKVGYYPV
jgi:hypothetical protein